MLKYKQNFLKDLVVNNFLCYFTFFLKVQILVRITKKK